MRPALMAGHAGARAARITARLPSPRIRGPPTRPGPRACRPFTNAGHATGSLAPARARSAAPTAGCKLASWPRARRPAAADKPLSRPVHEAIHVFCACPRAWGCHAGARSRQPRPRPRSHAAAQPRSHAAPWPRGLQQPRTAANREASRLAPLTRRDACMCIYTVITIESSQTVQMAETRHSQVVACLSLRAARAAEAPRRVAPRLGAAARPACLSGRPARPTRI